MSQRTIVLNFPKSLTKEPITYKLVKEYDLQFNILKAKIKPNEEGTLVIQLNGTEDNLKKGLNYITDIGINWDSLDKEIKLNQNNCIHCTACISQCPTRALELDRETMLVSFNSDKCIVCESCLAACAYKAITLEL